MEVVRPPTPSGSGSGVAPQLTVDQAGHRSYPTTMVFAMFPIQLCQAFIAPQAPNRMLHRNAPRGKGSVEGDILRWTVFVAWFSPWCHAQATRMQFFDADIRQVATCAQTFGQPLHHARFCQ